MKTGSSPLVLRLATLTRTYLFLLFLPCCLILQLHSCFDSAQFSPAANRGSAAIPLPSPSGWHRSGGCTTWMRKADDMLDIGPGTFLFLLFLVGSFQLSQFWDSVDGMRLQCRHKGEGGTEWVGFGGRKWLVLREAGMTSPFSSSMGLVVFMWQLRSHFKVKLNDQRNSVPLSPFTQLLFSNVVPFCGLASRSCLSGFPYSQIAEEWPFDILKKKKKILAG